VAHHLVVGGFGHLCVKLVMDEREQRHFPTDKSFGVDFVFRKIAGVDRMNEKSLWQRPAHEASVENEWTMSQ
jgi:hypothetical protein